MMTAPLSLGRMTAALATVHNENSASLATANIDFTLIKLEAPVEFGALGSTISAKRKIDAEEGALHKTARRLGALFEDWLPPTEELFRIYGRRVSEISSMPSINPRQDSDRGGVFASHMGADTASIWAAVTSGSGAIAAHLLGCMLARIFTGPEAISAWVELVEKQKEWIQNKQGKVLYSHKHQLSSIAAKQDISRTDLANWDASARAWLQSADQAKAFQHKQTMLILNNASIPVNNEPQAFTSIMKAWTTALEAMNNLAKGIPQRVQDGAALLGLSSWHLYPDMVVYGGVNVEVSQKDPLFETGALLTLGLQHVRDTQSVYWSLPLARLQYYGHPFQATRSIGQENARVTSRQFTYIMAGCLFAKWAAFASTNEEGLDWIDRIGTLLDLSQSTQPQVRDNSGKNDTLWLSHMFVAAREFLELDDSERKIAKQLMSLGRRQSTFLQSSSLDPGPIFGLCHIEVLLAVIAKEQQAVLLLRKFSAYLILDPYQFIIKYRPGTQFACEFASLLPLPRASSKRSLDGQFKENCPQSNYARWISLTYEELTMCIRWKDLIRDVTGIRSKLRKLKIELEAALALDELHKTVNEEIAPDLSKFRGSVEIEELEKLIPIAQRVVAIEALGELCLPVYTWDKDRKLVFSLEQDFIEALVDISRKLKRNAYNPEAIAHLVVGDDDAGICSLVPEREPPLLDMLVDPTFVKDVFRALKFNLVRLNNHLVYPEARTGLQFDRQHLADLQQSLRAYAVMADIYRLLPEATISTLVLMKSLSRAKWIPPPLSHAKWSSKENGWLSQRPTLAQAFSCIAMFESGTCNIDPDALSEVFAMSSGNSLYVAGALLCDPFENPGEAEIQRAVGNIGRPGISFLISPPHVKVREPDPEKWMTINHDRFAGKAEDNFQKTSVHLSFTHYEIPLVTEDDPRHVIDRGVNLIETLVSIYDGGDWIGEVDILKALSSPFLHRLEPSDHEQHFVGESNGRRQLNYEEALLDSPRLAATNVENWYELLEAPETGFIAVSAQKNWLARLAISAVCVDQKFGLIILPSSEPCWMCCAVLMKKRLALDHDNKCAMIC